MNKNKKWIVACAAIAVSAIGLGATLTAFPASADETNKAAILYYDFSADTIGASVDGFSSVKNLGTKENANATIYNGTGVSIVYDQLVFNQPEHASIEAGKAKGYFELPTKSFAELTKFTVQMDVTGWDAGGDREPIFAMTPTSLSTNIFGNDNQGLVFGDGYTTSDGTYLDSFFGGWAWTTSSQRPFIQGKSCLLTFVYDGVNASFYADNTLLLQKANSDPAVFASFDYFRIGGLMLGAELQALKANIDNVKLYDYARTFEQISEDSARVVASRVTEAGKAPLVYYDFEDDAANGVVKNHGTGLSTGSSDGKIVQTKGDVYLQDGKLVIDNDCSDSTDTTNGYFLLPTYLFYPLNTWTIEINVDHLDLQGDDAGSLFAFSRGADNMGSDQTQQVFWGWNSTYQVMAPCYQGRYDSMWTAGTSDIANKEANKEEPRTISLVFAEGAVSFVYNDQTLWTSPAVHGSSNYFTYFLFNRIGGYIQQYRTGADIAIDSFAFYDYARTNDQAASFNGMVENVVANLDSSAKSVTSYTAYDRFGKEIDVNVTFPETIDFETVGTKTYYVSVANQAAPARFTLTTTEHTHADENNDNACDGCGEIIDGIGKAYGINIGLNGTISANIFMELTDETIADEGAYMHTEYNGKIFEIPVKDAEVRENYYVFSVEVPAKEMDSVITSYMVRSNGDEGVHYTYSIKEYAEKMMVEDPTTEALLKQLLNYGTYAKAFFDGEEAAATAEMEAVTAETLAQYQYAITGELPEGIELVGMTLILESETTVRMYFKAASLEGYAFAINGEAAEAIAVGDYYCVEITDISAKDLDTVYEVSINGEFVLSYSAMSYAQIAIGGTNAALVKLVQALYLYNQAANAYFTA